MTLWRPFPPFASLTLGLVEQLAVLRTYGSLRHDLVQRLAVLLLQADEEESYGKEDSTFVMRRTNLSRPQ